MAIFCSFSACAVLLCAVVLDIFFAVILLTIVSTLILCFFWNDRMPACILATSARTICHYSSGMPLSLPFNHRIWLHRCDQSGSHTSIATIEFIRPPLLRSPHQTLRSLQEIALPPGAWVGQHLTQLHLPLLLLLPLERLGTGYRSRCICCPPPHPMCL